MTTADILYSDCSVDTLPTDKGVKHDFWFDRLASFSEQSRLLGLYQGIWQLNQTRPDLQVPADDLSANSLDKWRRDGLLLENIIKTYR